MSNRKPRDEHKRPLTATIDPKNRVWIAAHYSQLGFRSVSHLVDKAIGLLIETLEEEEAMKKNR